MYVAEDNGFDSRTVNQLLYKHKKKQNIISTLETQSENTNNNQISFRYTGNETTQLAKIFKQIDKNINIGLKTNDEFNNIENHNKLEKQEYTN